MNSETRITNKMRKVFPVRNRKIKPELIMISKGILFFVLFFLIKEFSVLQAQNLITVYPQEYPNALSNPLKGFRPDPPSAGNKNYPYPTIVRDYIPWNEIENDSTDGVQKIIDYCNVRWKDYEKMNVRVIPRVYIQYYTNPGDDHWPSDLTPGDWTSQEFKDRVEKLIYKLGLAWDNDPRVAWVQTGLIGWWGEQEQPAGVGQDGWVLRLGEAYTHAFKNKKLLVRNQKDWDAKGYLLGTYWDSFAHPNQSNVRTDIRDRNNQGRYLMQVIEGETAYNWGTASWIPKYGISPTATVNNYKYTNNLIDVIRELHCTGLGWVASYQVDGSEGSNIDTVKANASRIQNAFGYNYVIPEFSCSSRADQRDTFSVHFKIKNIGSAPFYENWPLAFVLIDETTREIVWKEPLTGVDVRTWLPGDNYSYTTRTYQTPAKEYVIDTAIMVPGTIPTGQYMAGITILEPYSQTPGIFFSVKNFLVKSQTQPLCRIGIGEDVVGGYELNPAIFGDPVSDNVRYYSLTPQGLSYTLSTNSLNGSVILHPVGGKYLPGTVVTVIVKSDFGYKFNSWSGDLSGSEKTTTITMDGDKSISAGFEAVPTYELNSSSTNGLIRINPPGSVFEEGANVIIKAVPDFGYQFSEWGGDLSGADNPASVVMNTNKTISASFSKLEGTVVFANNCGGQTFTSADGIKYSADSNFSNGSIYSTGAAIAGTTDDVLYQSERYGKSFAYNIPLKNGTYQVMLMFAETYQTSKDKRVFSVAIEGSPVITNLDIWAEAGSNSKYNDIFFITLTDEVLNISFITSIDNAKVSAIKILQTSTVPPPTGINDFTQIVPKQTILGQNYPNPFINSTVIPYQLAEASQVRLNIYNFLGQQLICLVNEYQPVGNYSIDWNAKDCKGNQIENGLYLYKLENGNNSVQTGKFILLK
jgi:hypothetical protein